MPGPAVLLATQTSRGGERVSTGPLTEARIRRVAAVATAPRRSPPTLIPRWRGTGRRHGLGIAACVPRRSKMASQSPAGWDLNDQASWDRGQEPRSGVLGVCLVLLRAFQR